MRLLLSKTKNAPPILHIDEASPRPSHTIIKRRRQYNILLRQMQQEDHMKKKIIAFLSAMARGMIEQQRRQFCL